jgi:epoxide hydrolase-like predicted phosphatase
MREPSIRAVIFDLGGVVLDSPLHAISRYERDRGIPAGFINRVVVDTGEAGAWSRLERGKLGMQEFFVAFSDDCARAGQEVSAEELMGRIGESSAPRPIMLEAIRRIRDRGLHAAALTNNWVSEDESRGSGALRPHFDTFIESSVLGLQKPDPRIYEHTCERIGIAFAEAVFLDDIGRNLKSARRLGMRTIKVDEPKASLAELEEILGFPLVG